jgi:hypothetical protein
MLSVTGAMMDTSTLAVIAVGIGSMLFAGMLAQDHGRSQARWIWIAAFIGPLAIPLFYAVVAASAVGKKLSAGHLKPLP